MADIKTIERRFTTHPVAHRVETRAEGDAQVEYHVIEGIAAKVESRTNLGWMDEIILKGAFDEVLADAEIDCRCLFNHDANKILARKSKSANTLELYLTAEGHLGYRYTTPNRSYAMDLQDAIMSGDVTQSSFAFRIAEDAWEYPQNGDANQNELRKIIRVAELRDVSPVTYPAYADTEVAKRSLESARGNSPLEGGQGGDNTPPNNEEQREGGKPLQRSQIDHMFNT